jgi:hypothetical protein
MAEAADQHHRLAQYFRRAAAMAARLWIEPDSPSQRHGEAIFPIFIDRGAPFDFVFVTMLGNVAVRSESWRRH